MHLDRKQRLLEVADSDVFAREKSSLDKRGKIELSYERFRAAARAARFTRQEVLDGLPLVEMFDSELIARDTALALLFITHFAIGLGTILDRTADRADLDDIVDKLLKVDVLCPTLMTELGYGNNVQSIETEARFDPATREFVIHTPNDRAQKFIAYTGHPVEKISVVWARLWDGDTDHGIYPFIVPIRDETGATVPGVSVSAVVDRMTPDPLDHAITRFDHVRIPERMFLGGRYGSFDADGTFRTELDGARAAFLAAGRRLEFARLSLVNATLRMARISIGLALEFAAQREIVTGNGLRFPVGALPTQRYPLMLSYVKYRAANALYREAMRAKVVTGTEPAGEIISVAKYTAIPLVLEAIQTCTERCGSHAFMERNLLSTYLLLTMHGNTADGDAMPLALQVARNMLRSRGYEPPAVGGATDRRSPLALMERREAILYRELADRVGTPPDPTAWVTSLNSAHELARSRGHRVALGLLAAEDEKLAEIFGLLLVREHGAWFAARDLVDRELLGDLDGRIERLALDLYPHEPEIREFLDSEDVLRITPMGQKDYVLAWTSLDAPADPALGVTG